MPKLHTSCILSVSRALGPSACYRGTNYSAAQSEQTFHTRRFSPTSDPSTPTVPPEEGLRSPVYIYIHMHMCTCIYVYVYAYLYVFVHVYVYEYVYGYECICICICICMRDLAFTLHLSRATSRGFYGTTGASLELLGSWGPPCYGILKGRVSRVYVAQEPSILPRVP